MILPPLGVPGGGIVLLLFFVHFVDPDKEQPVVFVSLLFYPGGEAKAPFSDQPKLISP